jgi:hypothetical protein
MSNKKKTSLHTLTRNLPLDLQYHMLDEMLTEKNPCKTKIYDRVTRVRNKEEIVAMIATKVINDAVRLGTKTPRMYTHILPEFASYIDNEKKKKITEKDVKNYINQYKLHYQDIPNWKETYDGLVQILDNFTKVRLCDWYTEIVSYGYRAFRKNRKEESRGIGLFHILSGGGDRGKF